MNARRLRKYIDDLLKGRRPEPFRPDDSEAAQICMAIELQAARLGSDAPRHEFLADLRRRLEAQWAGELVQGAPGQNTTRRQVIVGTSAAAAAAVTAVSVDRLVLRDNHNGGLADGADVTLRPNEGRWLRVAASSEVPDDAMRPFDLGSVSGFVRRVDGKPEAVSGVCTHQGCRLWFDPPAHRLRCPCHSTSFTPGGQVLNHQLPIAPKPLPTLMVREVDGVIEVFAPARPNEPA